MALITSVTWPPLTSAGKQHTYGYAIAGLLSIVRSNLGQTSYVCYGSGDMTTVRLAYGDTGLDLVIDPDVTTGVAPLPHLGTGPGGTLVRRALRAPVAGPPLRDRVRPGQRVAISACDGTRPQPREVMIPAILEELDGI